MSKRKPSHIKCYVCGVLTPIADKYTFITRGICARCSRIGTAKIL